MKKITLFKTEIVISITYSNGVGGIFILAFFIHSVIFKMSAIGLECINGGTEY